MNKGPFVLRRLGRRLLWRRPGLYRLFGLARGRGDCFDEAFDLWIGGYPRSANTFAKEAFKQANPAARIASHRHIPVFMVRWLRAGKPGIFLLREPEDAVLSWALQWQGYVKESLDYYIDFHRALLPFVPRLFIATFEAVTTDFGAVITRFNERFGTHYAPFNHEAEEVSECFSRVEKNSPVSTNELGVSRPSAQRDNLKDELRRQLRQSPVLMRKLQQARALYVAFASGLDPLNGWEEIAEKARPPSALQAWALARRFASGDGLFSFASSTVSDSAFASPVAQSDSAGADAVKTLSVKMLMRQAADRLKRFSVPVFFVGIALLIRLWLTPILHEGLPYAFFLAATIFTAWCAGTTETLLAVGLGYLAADWFFITPGVLGFTAVRDWFATGFYFFVSLAIVWFMRSTQNARLLAFASADQALRQRQRFEAEKTRLARTHEPFRMLDDVVATKIPINIVAQSQEPEQVRQKVRESYGQIAVTGGSCCGTRNSCCGSTPADSEELARRVGYSALDLAAAPDGANLGLSCGNPNALASLQPGEVVLDLGSGGGFDVFIAGRKVGPNGRVIGVDMTPEMLQRARQNLETYRQATGMNNIEFRLGEIEHLPVADASVDVVISNCVINLSPDKPQVWREIARVLKPGGRVAVSDLALLKPLPQAIIGSVEALVGCVAGAVLVSDTERMAREAGLQNLELNTRSAYVDSMLDWQDPLYQKIIAHLPAGARASDYVTSLEIKAIQSSRFQASVAADVSRL